MPPPKYNPSTYTPKKPKPLAPGWPAFEKSNKKFAAAKKKEEDFQHLCCKSDADDLADSFGKMSMAGNGSGKK